MLHRTRPADKVCVCVCAHARACACVCVRSCYIMRQHDGLVTLSQALNVVLSIKCYHTAIPYAEHNRPSPVAAWGSNAPQCHNAFNRLLCFLCWSTKHQNQKCLKTYHLISPPFMKSTPSYPCYIKQYIGIQKISIHNEKWHLKLCNMLFSVRCWSKNCSLVWNTLGQELKQPYIPISTFKSYPGMFLCITHMTPYSFAFLRPVITILHFELADGRVWSSPWGGLRSRHSSTSYKPVG
jgi:hypothetical protein